MNVRWIFTGSGGIRAGWSVAIFAAIIALEFGVVISIARALHGRIDRGGEIPPVSMLVIEIIMVAAVAIATYIMSRIEGRPFLSYGFSGPHKFTRWLWGALTGFVALGALVGLLALAHFIVFDKPALSGASIFGYALVWFAVFVLVGFAEESMIRGYILFTLARGLNFFWAAILVSILFGVVHSGNPGETPLGLIDAAVIGLLFCFSVWLTGSLWWAVGIHAAWDWSQSYLFGVADSGLRMRGHFLETHPAGNIWLSGGTTGPEGSAFCLLIALLIAVGLYLAWGRRPALRDKGSLFAQS